MVPMSMETAAFVLLSIPLVAVSRRILLRWDHHGPYRLILWECILWMSIRNRDHLIVERFDAQQILSSVLMIASLAFVLSAIRTMRTRGKADGTRRDSSLYGFEQTTVLVESGIFRHVRHPMYSSLLLLAWGVCLRRIDLEMTAVVLAATGATLLASWMEERENLDYFGEPYRRYMTQTKRFIPYVI
jgi:protein-S-isoprenylcysteine O-methyltransferase Ste14